MVRTVIAYLFVLCILVVLGLFALIFYRHACAAGWIGPVSSSEPAEKPMRIVVSMSTTPSGIDKLRPTLDSLTVAQKSHRLPDAVYVHVPQIFKRTGEPYIVPAWLTTYPGITLSRCQEDDGPITKLLPTLALESDPSTLIIVVDDDVIFAGNLVQMYEKYARLYPQEALTLAGYGNDTDINEPNWLGKVKLSMQHHVYMIMAHGTFAVRRAFFSEPQFSSYVRSLCQDVSNRCFVSDDLVISEYLGQRGIKKRLLFQVDFNYYYSLKARSLHQGADRLSSIENNDVKYAICHRALKLRPLPHQQL